MSGAEVTYGGVAIGTLLGGAAGTALTINLGSAATSASIDALIQNLTYSNSSDTPTSSRELRLNVIDAAGDEISSGGLGLTLTVIAENDAPVLADFSTSILFQENTVNSAPQLLDSDVSFTDAEGNFNASSLTINGLLSEDSVSVRNQGTGLGQIGLSAAEVTYGGVAIGTLSGGAAGTTLAITLNTAATNEAVEALIENLTYANSSDEPTATRDLTLKVTGAAEELASFSITPTTGDANPFGGVDVGRDSFPSFVDLGR